MDDSFGSLLYILITILAIVISALGKKKKKTTRRAPVINNENGNKEESIFSNLNRLINDEFRIPGQSYDKPEEDIDLEIKSNAKEEESPLDSAPTEMPNKEKTPYSIEYDDNSEIFANSIQHSEIKSDDVKDNTILEEFDIQKAIIYSEILNRKYI